MAFLQGKRMWWAALQGPLELLWGEHQCLAAVRRPARVSGPQGRAALVASVRRLTRKPSLCVSFQATKFGSQASQKVTKEASAFVLSRVARACVRLPGSHVHVSLWAPAG